MESAAEQTKPSRKETFDMLLAAQISAHDKVLDSGFRVAAVLTVVLGWLLTAASAQAFLRGAPQILWWLCMAVGAMGTVLIVSTFVLARRKTDRLYQRLLGLRYHDEMHLEQYRLEPRVYWSLLALNAVLCLLLLGGMVVVRVTPA